MGRRTKKTTEEIEAKKREEQKAEYAEELLSILRGKKIAFLSHAFAYTSFSSSTAYNFELEKMESVKETIKKNRANAKNYMVQKWIASDNATLQVAAYRLMSDPEEHKLLNQSYIDHTSGGEKVIFNGIDLDVKENDSAS